MQPGDKVKVINKDKQDIYGKIGTIQYVLKICYRVSFGDGYFRYLYENELELIKPNK